MQLVIGLCDTNLRRVDVSIIEILKQCFWGVYFSTVNIDRDTALLPTL